MQKQVSNLKAIILAGGEGTRLQSFVKQIYGYSRPKQYCTFVGNRSMLSHTVKRAEVLISQKNQYVVANSNHNDYLLEEFGENPLVTIMQQPVARETSAGILLPILKIEKTDPDAIVVIMPSDHFILDETAFMENVKSASQLASKNPNSIIMLGIRPGKLESGYGWIETGEKVLNETGKTVYCVKSFVEKPAESVTRELMTNGALINTFVLVGKCSAFINHMQSCVPELVKAFAPIRRMLGTKYEKIIINRFFKHLPEYNFSSCVLQKITKSLLVLEMKDVYWSDWGEEERVIQDLEKMNHFLVHADLM